MRIVLKVLLFAAFLGGDFSRSPLRSRFAGDCRGSGPGGSAGFG
jgi:hypothetical protein